MKFPNLISVNFANRQTISMEYIARFLRAFPLLTRLQLDLPNEVPHYLIESIITLRHLRKINIGTFTDRQIRIIILNLHNIETLRLCDSDTNIPSRQTLLLISQMTQLRALTIGLEVVRENLQLLANTNSFPKLTNLSMLLNNDDIYYGIYADDIFEDPHIKQIATELENIRPELELWLDGMRWRYEK